jgi:8-oxo-dGTP pyrophosphatase MutT (NUDIX family)
MFLMQANIASFLRSIPQSNQDAQSIQSIAHNVEPAILYGFALMLQTIGVVQLDEQQNIRATSQTAKYMLHSIASYVEADVHWIDDWHTRGIYRNGENPLQNAATLLHTLEQRRMMLVENPLPSRSEEVAQVLIKRTNPETAKPELLFQFDANANQFQLIGGRRSEKDDSLLATMIREIEEELANTIVYGKDYNLNCIIPDLRPPTMLSHTFGALTAYHFGVFHMVDMTEDVKLQPDDEWVPVEDMLAGYVVNAADVMIPFNTTEIYHLINRTIPGGLAALPDSFRASTQ